MKNRLSIILLISTLLILFVGAMPASAQDESETRHSIPYVSYTVTQADAKHGLTGIAKQFCTTWQEIYSINQATIGPNPNVIKAGMILSVPDRCNITHPDNGSDVIGPYTYYRYDRGERTYAKGTVWNNVYTTAYGDRLGHIAQRFGVPMVEVQKANGIINPDHINNGQQILLPGIGGSQPLGDFIRYLGATECVISPNLNAALFAYPDSPIIGQNVTTAAQYARQAVRTATGAVWYRLPGEQGTGNASVWIRSFDIGAFTGDCGI